MSDPLYVSSQLHLFIVLQWHPISITELYIPLVYLLPFRKDLTVVGSPTKGYLTHLPASVRLYFIAVDSGKQLNSVAKAALGGMSLAENSGVLTALLLLLLRRWGYRR